ncbi:Na+/H+ antiporter NhaC family protein [Kurthia huakuii]|uniref:Na+/H+ antiporter NhaC family protein n=1 Tax=Kurthia huakuii TaxID=1421019 RepID=UPI000496F5B3|nr:Na+/H+ antiporter NhaC family protein [Kurthia huakuii]MBM7699645.1 NhaC family Na+:H+ antiporter [Kurthia huakuii]
MEFIVFGLFACSLLLCVAFEQSILWALAFGYLLFFMYGLKKGHAVREMMHFSWDGIRQIKGMLFIFVLIGMMTGIWRAAGTIPMIIDVATGFLVPSIFIIVVFLLNCLVSVLTGTAFGTVATVGVICMTIGNVMGENPLFVAGAILSGIYFGDRCSPMSTSALLVCELTHMKLFEHIRQMIKTAAIPFAITSIIYIILGFIHTPDKVVNHVTDIFADSFVLNGYTLIPAALIFVLLLLKMKIKPTMFISIVSGIVICAVVQQMSMAEIASTLWGGYVADNMQLGAMLDGGGIVSMVNVIAIVCLSSSYFGIFNGTNMLESVQHSVELLADKTTNFFTGTVVSIVAIMISCNQTLAVMLTYQLNKDIYDDDKKTASMLADTAIVIPPLIPWSIACAVPLAAIDAPVASIFFASYLYLLPLAGIIRSFYMKRQTATALKPL